MNAAKVIDMLSTANALLECWARNLPDAETLPAECISPLQVTMRAICELLRQAERAYGAQQPAAGFELVAMYAHGLATSLEGMLWRMETGEADAGFLIRDLALVCREVQRHVRQAISALSRNAAPAPLAQGSAA